jgi:ribosome-binding factor A
MQANPRRVARVTKQIERELGQIMLTDKIMVDVMKTKSTEGDARGAVCSCSGVEVTSDLQLVKVYVSVFTEDEEARVHTLKRLSGLSGCVDSTSAKLLATHVT